jgi:hypothetical protein
VKRTDVTVVSNSKKPVTVDVDGGNGCVQHSSHIALPVGYVYAIAWSRDHAPAWL